MKKKVGIVILSIIGLIILIGIVLFFINFNRVKKQEVPFYKTQTNIPETKFESTELKDLPQNYDAEQAAKDGCFVIVNNKIYNKNKLDSFILNTGINSKNRKADKIRVVQYTTEGDAIITDIEYKMINETKWNYIVTKDNTRDNFASQNDKKITINEDIPDQYYEMISSEKSDRVEIILALYGEINLSSDKTKYKDIAICSYPKDALVIETYPSFYARVVETNSKWIIVEPNEKEDIHKSADRIVIGLGENNDAIYAVGTNVKITYTGYIMETYPAQIDAINIEVKSADEFEIIFNDKQPQSDTKIWKILEKSENDKYSYNIYAYDGNVNIFINGENLSLRDALLNNKITIEEIIEKANNDLKQGKVMGAMYADGGSMIYKYSNYSIIKYHTLDGNRDVYIGSIKMNIDVKDEK